MKRSAFGAMLAAAVLALALVSPAAAKTAKECRAEWSAHKAENKAKGITEKAYVAKCRGETEKPKAAAKTKEKAAEKKAKTSKETKKEKAAEKKESKKKAAATSGKKTVKECEAEWRANKAANQAKSITEKAYVAQCRSGTAMVPAAAPEKKMSAPAAPAPAKKTAAPAAAPAKKMATPAPATGKPAGANQYASEGAAKSHCRGGTVVWANLNSKIYHFTGSHAYGQTKQGAYMCEKDAMAQGMRAAKNEKHP